MYTRQSPHFMTSGALGLLAGVAIAGGLLMALSPPAHSQEASVETAMDPVPAAPAQTVEQVESLQWHTFGNSTARAVSLAKRARIEAESQQIQARGEEVASGPGEWILSDASAAVS